jgi:general secretion pathway protein G
MNPPAISSASRPQSSGLALASLILGICGIVLCLGPLAGIPAVICGHTAQSQIKRSGGMLSGAGMATAGLITGYISILMIFVIGLMAAIAIPNFVKARKTAQYQACQVTLKMIQDTKESWALENRKTENAVPSQTELQLDGRIFCPGGGAYEIKAVNQSPACSLHGPIAGR